MSREKKTLFVFPLGKNGKPRVAKISARRSPIADGVVAIS
jgi:hypothetical protein